MRAILALLTITVFALADALNNGLTADGRSVLQEAVRHYTQAIKLDPNDADAYVNRGASYALLNDLKKATRDARKACELGDCDLLQKLEQKGSIRN